MKRLLLLLALLAQCNTAFSQTTPYPKGYFRNPLRIPIILAGNFGECRPGHFHSGVDIKTAGHENEPVYAAADGYVSRIKMEPGGFGHGLYITHPNGYTTLYAHLNNFIPKIQDYVRGQQYVQQKWTVDLQFSPTQFPVKKGQQIAFSGNTGSSTAPHLHFEIRNTKTEHPLNPQLFGFDIIDTRAPVAAKLAIYQHPFELADYTPQLYKLSVQKGAYRPNSDTVFISNGYAGLGIIADDYMNGSENTLAFLTVKWFADDKPAGSIRLDNIGYDETRYVNAYADYSTRFKSSQWVQCLFRLPGNELRNIYSFSGKGDGTLTLGQDEYKHIRIELEDAAGNKSLIAFTLAQRGPVETGADRAYTAAPGRMNIFDEGLWSFYLDETSLYSYVYGAITSLNNATRGVRIFSPNIPVHHAFELRLKQQSMIPFTERDNVVMMYSDGKDTSGKAATVAEKGFYKASVRAFGDYWLDVDTTAPVIKPVSNASGSITSTKRILFKADDAMTSVKTFRGELDGKWILFEQHNNNWFYDIDAHCPSGNHRLVIKATDENGNEAVKEYIFTR